MRKRLLYLCACLLLAGCSQTAAPIEQESAREFLSEQKFKDYVDELKEEYPKKYIYQSTSDGYYTIRMNYSKYISDEKRKDREMFAKIMEQLGCTASREEINDLFNKEIENKGTVDDFHGIHRIEFSISSVTIYAYPEKMFFTPTPVPTPKPSPTPTKAPVTPTPFPITLPIRTRLDLELYLQDISNHIDFPAGVEVTKSIMPNWEIVQIYCVDPANFPVVEEAYLYMLEGLGCTESVESQKAEFEAHIGTEGGLDYDWGGIYRVIFSAPNEYEFFYRVDIYVKYD